MSIDHPTVLVERYRAAALIKANENSYKGLSIHALPGLHEYLAAKAVRFLKAEASLLDLAAGSGAMSVRMQDLGFRVTATDYVSENFKANSVPFVRTDLNGTFSSAFSETFDAIVASEIIEHLENPRHFARECFRLLHRGGRILLSTPNIENAGSKASFIRSGHFTWFAEKDYLGHGHITPLTHWQLDKSFLEAGFRFLWKGSYGSGASQLSGSPRLRLLASVGGTDVLSICRHWLAKYLWL